jgi:phage terminase large subunit GpA-like protein
MDAACDPLIPEVVVMKSTQVGWTEILNNTIGFFIDQTPAPILMLQPTLDMADAWSKDRLAPMIRDTPALTDKVAEPKSRDSGNTLLHKRFPGGHLTVVGANSPSGLASRPIRVLLCDEVDRFPVSAGTEGDPIDLARRRTATFRNRRILMGSTPTIKGSSRIESAFEQSDQRYFFVPCPQCGAFQRLMWPQVRWPDGQPELAVYVCQHCAGEISEASKPEMLRAGQWRGTKPSNGIAGFHISELYSPWVSWAEMAQAFLRAKKLPETLQTWINTALGETWEDQGEKLEAGGLLVRRESYTSAAIPPGVMLITVGTDVQDDRLESFVYGWGRDEEAWRLEHLVLRGDPGGEALWREHDALLRRRFRTDDGRELAIEATCIDSGGHFTEAVYRYCHARKRYRVWAIKGVAGPGRPVWQKRPSRGGKLRVDLWPIGVDTVKDLIFGRLKRVKDPGPGYFHFDAGADEAFFDQLASEVLVYRVAQGRRIRLWRPRAQGARQEGLDGTVYAYAAMIGRGGVNLLEARADRAPSAPVAAGPATDVPSNEGAGTATEAPVAESALPSSMEAIADPNLSRKKRVRPPRRLSGWMKRRY